MKIRNLSIITLTILVLLNPSCKKEEEIIIPEEEFSTPENLLLNINTNRTSILVGTSIDLECSSGLYDDDILDFDWSCTGGELFLITSNSHLEEDLNTNQLKWEAPFEEGSYMIYCSVTDYWGNINHDSISIMVNRPTYTNISDVYLNRRLIHDLEFINESTFLTFKTPFYDIDIQNKIMESEYLTFSNLKLSKAVNYSLFNGKYDYTNQWSITTLNSNDGALPSILQIKLEYVNDYLYVSSYFDKWNMQKFKVNGQTLEFRGIIRLDDLRILDLESNNNNELFAISAPEYSDQTLTTPPIIWKFDEYGSHQKVFEFPDYYDYNGTSDYGFESSMTYDMAFDSKNNLYIAMPYCEIIYRLNIHNELEIWADDIAAPSGICFAKNDFMFIKTAAQYAKNGDLWDLAKPSEIIIIDESGDRKILENIDLNETTLFGGLRIMQNGSSYLCSS
jgi:hypothetical protein